MKYTWKQIFDIVDTTLLNSILVTQEVREELIDEIMIQFKE